MDQKQLFKQVVEFNKAAFNNTFNAMVTLQDQAERMTTTMLDQSTWLPAEGRKAVKDWVDACKQGRENFKQLVDDNFQKVEEHLTR